MTTPGARGAVILSAVAGYVDTAGYIALYGLFTAHVTGNLVTAGAAVARRASEGVAARLAMIPIFMISVAATTIAARAVRARGRDPLFLLLAAMTAALALFGWLGVALAPFVTGPDAPAIVAIGGAGVAALGVQNALMREALATLPPTTVMTGNLTQLTIDLVALASRGGGASERAAAEARARKFAPSLLAFVAGAALGAWATGAFGLASIAGPTAAVGVLALASRQSVPATKQGVVS
jgi:uncharacterized membrane protein YoaK (UPF0700 family)